MKKYYDKTFKKGVHSDDSVNEILSHLNDFSHKPTERESKKVNGDTGDLSYFSVYDKRFRIVLYVED
jgi:hypothetical protein